MSDSVQALFVPMFICLNILSKEQRSLAFSYVSSANCIFFRLEWAQVLSGRGLNAAALMVQSLCSGAG